MIFNTWKKKIDISNFKYKHNQWNNIVIQEYIENVTEQ